jgi:RHS repeat-associated protein
LRNFINRVRSSPNTYWAQLPDLWLPITYKVFGPDLEGGFGSLQGIGGLEATVNESAGTLTPVVNDVFGNVVGWVSGTSMVWNGARVGSYGVLPETVAVPLDGTHGVAEASVWRTRRLDPTGLYWMGARYYEPKSGRFLSADPQGHESSMNLYDYASGDPANALDPDGRLSKEASPAEIATLMKGVYDSRGSPELYGDLSAEYTASLVKAGLTPSQATIAMHELVRRQTNPNGGARTTIGSLATAQALGAYAGTEAGQDAGAFVGQAIVGIAIARGGQQATMGPSQPLALPGPTQGQANALRGNDFQQQASDALRVEENTIKVAGITLKGQQGNTEPDLDVPRTGVVDMKDWLKLSFTDQLQLQYSYAAANNKTFSIIISPRTEIVSKPLQAAVAARGGIIIEFDPATKSFRSVRFNGNKVIR